MDDIMQQVRRLQIRTRRQVSDVLSGAYLSVFKGSGVEFDEVRPYVPGDDVRSIDWNVTARTGVPHIKRFVEERELSIMLLVDTSSSMDFGSIRQSKRRTASELSALVAFSAIANQDKVGVMLFDAQSEHFIPPRKGQKHVLRIIRDVLSESTAVIAKIDLPWWKRWQNWLFRHQVERVSKKSHLKEGLAFCHRILPKRSIIFVVSDFLDEGYWETLGMLNSRHDVVLVSITDPAEYEIPQVGLLRVVDSETGQMLIVDSSTPQAKNLLYQKHQVQMQHLQNQARSNGMDLIELSTNQDVLEPLLAFLKIREKRGVR